MPERLLARFTENTVSPTNQPTASNLSLPLDRAFLNPHSSSVM